MVMKKALQRQVDKLNYPAECRGCGHAKQWHTRKLFTPGAACKRCTCLMYKER